MPRISHPLWKCNKIDGAVDEVSTATRPAAPQYSLVGILDQSLAMKGLRRFAERHDPSGEPVGSGAQQSAAPSRRVRDRLEEKARDLARSYDEALARATSWEKREAVEAAYVRLSGEGIKHHERSDFSEPPKHEFGPDDSRLVMKAFYEYRDWLHRNRAPHQRKVPESRKEVLQYLLNLAVRGGQVFPSHQHIAERVGWCERTVRHALAWLRDNGFLSWQRRLRWARGELGTKLPRQTSNAYRIALRGLAKIGAAVLNIGNGGNKCRVAHLSAAVDADCDFATPLFRELSGAG